MVTSKTLTGPPFYIQGGGLAFKSELFYFFGFAGNRIIFNRSASTLCKNIPVLELELHLNTFFYRDTET